MQCRISRRSASRLRSSVKAMTLALATLLLAHCGAYSGEASGRDEQYADREQAQSVASPESVGYSEEAESRREYVASADRAPSAAPAPQASRPAGGAYRVQQEVPKKSYAPQSSASSGQPPYSQQPQQIAKGREVKGERKVEQPMVVYFGYLRLRVRRQIEAFDELTKLAQAAGGYVQTLSGRTVVLRVPATDFDAAMARFGAVGEILERRVKAVDVSRQFTDIETRLVVAQQARARLLQLLERVRTTDERLQILEEIKRLTESIETSESTLAALRNLADFFTITIDIEPIVVEGQQAAHRSAFAWIRNLLPHLVTLTEGKKAISMTMPKGFVQFLEDDVFRAQAADTSLLRVGRVTNEPVGDAAFWSQAIDHELQGRDEELVDQKVLGKLQLRVYRNKDVRPRYYVVGAAVVDKYVYCVEVFLPNDAAWTLHKDNVYQALGTLEVKP